jgi:NAD(P)-dependent dehydrogenase (short-subunit alcohol dehydrogenase family)
VALVVGAGGGIGGAGAEALAREGAAVFCTDRTVLRPKLPLRGFVLSAGGQQRRLWMFMPCGKPATAPG